MDPKGVVSVYQGVTIPTGRRKTKSRGYSGFGDLDPPNPRRDALVKGELLPEELDDEELSYGITKCRDGKFSIKAAYDSSQLPKRIRDQMMKELLRRSEAKLGSFVLGAIQRLGEIATQPGSDDKDALKAIEMITARVMGKTPDRVIHTQEKAFEVVIENIARGSREESRRLRGIESVPAEEPLEVEVIEEEEPEEYVHATEDVHR